MRTMYLVRGLSGSGKTSLASALIRINIDSRMFAADDFFTKNGEYKFAPHGLTDAHLGCQANAACEAIYGSGDIIIHNTFSQRWEMDPYIDLAREKIMRLVVIDLFDGGLSDRELMNRSKHGVQIESIQRMRQRWEARWSVS